MNRSKRITSTRTVTWFTSAVLASAATLTPVYAGERYPEKQPSGGSTMQQLDTNQDGRVSRAEAQRDTALSKRFDAIDANRDGVLDAAELAAPDNQAARRGTEVKQ